MKKFLFLAVSTMVFCWDRILSFGAKLRGRSLPKRKTVLLYHDVEDAAKAPFARQMRWLCRYAEAGDFGDLLGPAGKRDRVWVTFDDALTGVFRNAIPILGQHRVPCVIFIPAGWLGRRPGWKNCSRKERRDSVVATAEVLRQHVGDLVTYGSHGLQHIALTEAASSQVASEIIESKACLEEMLQRPMKLYAFAYGQYTSDHVDLCRQAGYQAAFAAMPSWREQPLDGFLLGRTSVTPCDGLLEFYLKIRGAFRWHGQVAHLKRRIVSLFRPTKPSSQANQCCPQ